MINKWLMSSNTDNRATPQAFFDELDKEFWFTLDVCADDINHKCAIYFTKDDDGLSKNWNNSIIFMNPPYWKEIGKRVKKASEAKGGIVVCLLPARTDTRYFHDYIYWKAEIRFIKWRLKFWWSKNSAPFPSMVVIFNNPTTA